MLHFLPPAISSAHAALGQTFFCLAVAIAMFTGKNWTACEPIQAERIQAQEDRHHPKLFTLVLLSIFILYVQMFLGAMFRHHGMSWGAHVMNAPLVAIVLTWTGLRALTQYPAIRAVRRPAMLMIWLLITQLCLGFMAFITRVAWGHDAVQPELPMVISTVAHVAVGALLLATTVILAVQVWHHIPAARRSECPTESPLRYTNDLGFSTVFGQSRRKMWCDLERTSHTTSPPGTRTDSSTQAVISVQNLVHRYERRTALDGVSFDVRPAELFGLLGPNGSGKLRFFVFFRRYGSFRWAGR